jgi:hypothetical protein
VDQPLLLQAPSMTHLGIRLDIPIIRMKCTVEVCLRNRLWLRWLFGESGVVNLIYIVEFALLLHRRKQREDQIAFFQRGRAGNTFCRFLQLFWPTHADTIPESRSDLAGLP